jgi:septum formation protein
MRELHTVVLASVSPRRRELLSSLGLRVLVVPSDVEEGDRPGYGPLELARLHATAKAEAVARRKPGELTVAADTVVDLDGVALGKPVDAAEAAAMLGRLSGRRHAVHTAFCAIDGAGDGRLERALTTQVWFAPLSPVQIEAYVATGEPFDKAGGYGIQGRGAALVERIEGDFYTVMGFPLGEFVRSLPELGYRLWPAQVAVTR